MDDWNAKTVMLLGFLSSFNQAVKGGQKMMIPYKPFIRPIQNRLLVQAVTDYNYFNFKTVSTTLILVSHFITLKNSGEFASKF